MKKNEYISILSQTSGLLVTLFAFTACGNDSNSNSGKLGYSLEYGYEGLRDVDFSWYTSRNSRSFRILFEEGIRRNRQI